MNDSIDLFGNTRTNVCAKHALFSPDAHVPSVLENWKGIVPYFIICHPLSHSFQQILGKVTEEGEVKFKDINSGIERFFFVHSGSLEVNFKNFGSKKFIKNDFFFLPPNEEATLYSDEIDGEFTIFEKKYVPLKGHDLPKFVSNSLENIKGEPFLGYERAMLQNLLPDAEDLSFDMAVNYFKYETGATLPLVETHIMEHGMVITEGQGVYRLENKYYPVKEGDIIWMAPFCPQWYVSMGDIPSAYLYYKDVNRNPLG